MKNLPPHMQGLIFASLGALALTPDGLLVRLAGTHEWTTVFWRAFLISLALFAFYFVTTKERRLSNFIPQTARTWLAAVFSSIGTLTFVLAIIHTTVANALVILSTMSLFAAFLSMVFLKERIARRTWLAMMFAIIGIIIVFLEAIDGGGLLGKIFALICAFTTAANMTVIRSEPDMKVPLVFAWAAMILAIPAFFIAPGLALQTSSGLTFIVMAGLNAFAMVMIGAGAQRIPSPEVSLLMLLETILGPVWVWAILAETPSINALIGGTIVVITLASHALAGLRARK